MNGRRTFLLVDGLLVVLALLSIGVAHVNLSGWNSVVALGIAAVKALLIVLFFMELKVSSPVIRLVAVAAVVWLGFLFAGTLDDVLTRNWLPIPGK
jgi:cytochrome c oxidase subunit 4